MIEDVENDLRELIMKRWMPKANNGKEWASVLKEVNIHREP
jgi:hypothetical protein